MTVFFENMLHFLLGKTLFGTVFAHTGERSKTYLMKGHNCLTTLNTPDDSKEEHLQNRMLDGRQTLL